MNAGELRHKIIIQYNAAAGTTDDNGNPLYDWQPITSKPIWAKREGLKGRTFYQAAAVQAESDVIFTIRYRTDVKAGMHVIEGTDEIFDIYLHPVDADGHRWWLEIHARAVLTNGG